MRARWIGPYLRRYRDERAIPERVKIASLVMMWITIGYSVVVFPNLLVRFALLATAVGGHLALVSTASREIVRDTTAVGGVLGSARATYLLWRFYVIVTILAASREAVSSRR